MMTPMDIPGYINHVHVEDLTDLIRKQPDGIRILEIGCAYGRSTWTTMSAMGPNSTLTVVDTFGHLKPSKLLKGITKSIGRGETQNTEKLSENMRVLRESNDQRTLFNHVLEQHPARDRVTVHQMYSQDYRKQFYNDTFDVVYLDGEHTYEAVRGELKHFANTPVLCGDDWGPSKPGVTRAIDEFRAQHPNRTWYEPRLSEKSGFWSITQ